MTTSVYVFEIAMSGYNNNEKYKVYVKTPLAVGFTDRTLVVLSKTSIDDPVKSIS